MHHLNCNARVICLFVIAAISGGSSVYPQNNPFVFRHITVEDGLAGNDVRSIIQDSKGFMWFATDNGLQKYDGYNFTTYHHIAIDSQSISSDNLNCLMQDKQKNIWSISFLSGFNRLDPITNKSVLISDIKRGSLKELFLPTTTCLDTKGNVWLVAANNIACYESATGQMTFLKPIIPKSFQPYFENAQYDADKNQLWIADANYGICMYDLNKKSFYSRDNNPDHIPLLSVKCKPIIIYLDKEKNLWIHNFSGYLLKYNLISNTSESFNLYETSNGIINLRNPPVSTENKAVSITTIKEDSHGHIWVAAGTAGLLRYIPQKDSFEVTSAASPFANGLHLNSIIHCIDEDTEGNIWIGTDKGINVFNPYRQQFHFFENDPAKRFSQSAVETMDFIQTKTGDLWVGTWGGGITVFDADLKMQRNMMHQNGNVVSLAEPGSRVWSLLANEQGNILAGCQHGFLSVVDPLTKSIVNFHPEGLRNLTIENLRSDDRENIWMALYAGIGKWDTKKDSFSSFMKFVPYGGVDSATASDVLPDHRGNIWVGTLGLGLQKFDVSRNRFTEIFVPEKAGLHNISSALINCMVPINDSLIAIGSGSGIDIFNTSSKQFSSIGTLDGLPSNNVLALYFIPPYDLWATAGNMICKINLENKHIIRFGPQDGIRSLDFSSCHHFYRMTDGRLLAGYAGGFLFFHPDSVNAGEPPANVSFTGLQIFDHHIAIDSLLQQNDTISLSYKQNFITIQYASLSYWEANRTNYFYKLEGIDKAWVNAHDQRFATYTNLQGSTYIFRVKCENSDGVPCKEITSLILIIRPPFWQTWWFKMSIALIFGLVLYVLYRYRIDQILKLQHVRNEISKDLHDDVGSTLSSITILSQVAKDKMEEGLHEQSSSIMSKINNYAQEMVEKMGDIVWAVNAVNDNALDIIQRLKNAFMQTTTSKGILLQFFPDPSFEKLILPIQVRKNMYLICKEAINNAIKYAGCSQISVSFILTGSQAELRIADNGKGFDQRKLAYGNGLTNMRARATEIKGKLIIDSAIAGTTVVLCMHVPRNR
jgi:ligand-binding sensor domain-containing protein